MTKKPVLAIVANAPSPYRIHQHRRIARELRDQIELRSVFLHEHNWQPWDFQMPEEIHPIVFGKGELLSQKNQGLGPIKQWIKMGKVIRTLKQAGVDAVIFTGYNDPGLVRLLRWCKRSGIPSFMFSDSNVYGDRQQGWRRTLKGYYVRWVVRSLSGLLPCGSYGRQYYDQYGGKDKPVFYMPHEPDYSEIFAVTPEQRRAVQKKFGLKNNRRYFVYAGRLAQVKRVDTLIDAFVKIAAERPDWDLLLIGGGPLEQELRDRVPQELAARVVWTGFIDDVPELSALYTCGDVFVLPSSSEPWAVVVSEAAAAGLALVVSEVVGAAGELCRPELNGAKFPPGDVPALRDALLEVTADQEHTHRLRLASLQVLDQWRRQGDPVQGVRLALAYAGLLDEPSPVEPNPPTPTVLPFNSESTNPSH